MAKETKKNELMTEDYDFFDGHEGQGLETIGQGEQSVAYLSMIQPDSGIVDEKNPAGTWRNTATGRNFGTSIRVIVVAFKTVWNEREGEAPFRTIARYEPNSIPVEMKQPKAGKRGYPKMYNKESGNEIQELYVYAVILPDYPEEGVLFFNPTVSSMRSCRSWNTMLKSQILPNGKQAPIFGLSWRIYTSLIQNPQKQNGQIAVLSKIEKDTLITREIFDEQVNPKLDSVNESVLQIATTSEVNDDSNGD